MIERAGCREAQGTRLDRITGKTRHFGDVGFGRVLAVRAPVSHYIDAQRRVRELGGDVDIELTLVEEI